MQRTEQVSSGAGLLLLLGQLLVMLQMVHGYRIDVSGPMSGYDYVGYRQMPHFMVGMFSRTSPLSYASGSQDVSPTVTISIDITGTAAASAQIYIYNADVIERAVWKDVPGAHPCMDLGQNSGVGIAKNMSENAFGVAAGMLMVGEPFYTIREKLYLKDTGLYIVTFNVCRYKNVTFQTANGTWLTRRQLDVTGWRDMKLTGFVDFHNPFGFLPGQSYGFLPTYVTLFALSLIVLLIYSVMAFRVGRERMLRYQWVLLALAGLSVLAYLLLMSYFSNLNRSNTDSYGVFITGSLLLIVRNTVGALAMFLMCYGWGVCHRSVPPVPAFIALAGVVVRLGVNLCEFLMSQALFSVRTGIAGFSSSDNPAAAWRVLRVTGIVLDLAIGVACAVALLRCIRTLSAQNMRAKLLLFKRTSIGLGIGAVLAAGWAGIMLHESTAPLMTFGEVQWEVAWVPDAVWELLYFSIFTTVLMIWLPQVSSYYQFYGEEIPAGGDNTDTSDSKSRQARRKGAPKLSKPSPAVTPSHSAAGDKGPVIASAVVERKPRPTVSRGTERFSHDATDAVELDLVPC